MNFNIQIGSTSAHMLNYVTAEGVLGSIRLDMWAQDIVNLFYRDRGLLVEIIESQAQLGEGVLRN